MDPPYGVGASKPFKAAKNAVETMWLGRGKSKGTPVPLLIGGMINVLTGAAATPELTELRQYE